MGGTLKFKGDEAKKKKRSSSSKELVRGENAGKADPGTAEEEDDFLGDARYAEAPSSVPYRTEAERRFEEVKRQRLAKKAAKEAGKSHKDRVAEFNEKLEKLSEHHDLPKVGPG